MSHRTATSRIPRRVSASLLAALACVLSSGSAVASSEFLQSLPPGEVLRFQPRSFEEASRLPESMSMHGGARVRAAHAPGPLRSAADLSAARWQEAGPPLGAGRALVFDARRGRLLQVGGERRSDGPTVWGWRAGEAGWRRIADQPDPGAGLGAFLAAAYDSLRDRLLVLRNDGAGLTGRPVLDALELSGSHAWKRLWTGPPGSGLNACIGMVVDRSRDRAGIVGAREAGSGVTGIAWVALVGTGAWTFAPASGEMLPGEDGGSAVYDARRDSIWAIAGGAGGTSPGVLLRIAADASAHVSPQYALSNATFPMCDAPLGLALDAALDRLILVSAAQDARAVPLHGGPVLRLDAEFACNARRQGFALAFDDAARRLFLCGGRYITFAFEDLLSLDADDGVPTDVPAAGAAPQGWREESPLALGSRLHHSVTWDPARRRLVVYGGWTATPPPRPAMTLSVDSPSGWVPLGGSGASPMARFGQSFALDAASDAALLFGGQAVDGSGAYLGDLWRLPMDGGPWQPLSATGESPGARRGAALFADPARGRWIVMGGDDGATLGHSAWELRLEPAPSWRRLAVAGEALATRVRPFADPAAGCWWGMDPFGRLFRITLSADTLTGAEIAIDGEMPPGVTPDGFDPQRRRLLLFTSAPFDPRARLDEPFAIEVGETARVAAIAIEPAQPPATRLGHGTAFDAAGDRMWLVGGYDDDQTYFGDTWQLQWQTPVPVAAALAYGEADAASTRMAWAVSGAASARGSVERSEDGVAWSVRGEATASGADLLRFEDAPLAPSQRVAYRLVVSHSGERFVTTASWLERAAAGSRLALAAAENPARGALRLRTAIPEGPPATLELFDASGRSLASVRLSASDQHWTFTAPGAPGLYLARLRQGAETRMVKLAASR